METLSKEAGNLARERRGLKNLEGYGVVALHPFTVLYNRRCHQKGV